MTVGAVATAVVAGSATGVLAAPASAPTASVVMNESLTPVLRGEATAAGTGTESLRFSARTVGAATWDLLDGASVAGRAATKRITAAGLEIGEAFEYRVEHCDDTGCTASGVQTGHVSPDLAAGRRPGATRLPFTLGDKISAQVDVGSGNLLVTTSEISLRRIAGAMDLGMVYNGRTLAPGSRFQTDVSPGWRFSTGSGIGLKQNPGASVTVYGADGVTGTFFRQSGSTTAYDSPKTMKATLTRIDTATFELTWHDSGDTWIFTAGRLDDIRDRAGNISDLTYNSAGQLTRAQSDLGPHNGRTVAVASDAAGRISGLSQTPDGAPARSVGYGYDAAGRLDTITDVLGRVTDFDYDAAGNLAAVTAPGGAKTTFGYDDAHRVTSVTQPSDAAGDAVTRLVYDSGVTLVADPNTDPAAAVGAVPHTRYDLTGDGMKLIAKATDPTGAVQSATYTPFFDVASATNSSGTATFGYDPAVNGGESMTGAASPTGAGSSFAYGNTAPAQYLPSAGTDAQGGNSQYTYDSSGNALSSTDAGGAAASVARNADGTIDTATDPKGNVTDYTNTLSKQVRQIDPPAGNSLAARSYGYDGYGRLATATSGRGITATYAYDAADRVTGIDFSDTTASLSYTYDPAGRVHTRTDASGTTTYTYDPIGRLASRTHTAGGGTLTYGYDLAGNLVAETDGTDTTSHAYDTRNLITATTTPDGRTIRYAHDADRRRTDTWFASNADNTAWAAHTRTDYDASGRTTRVWTARNSSDTTRVSDLAYTYAAPASSTDCPTAVPAGTDTGLRWSQTDHLAGTTTSYCYDPANRLTRAATPGADTWAYSYDANGNRTQTTKNGAVVDSQTHNSANQLTGGTHTGWAYDGAGNLTTDPTTGTSYSYTGADQLAAATGAVTGSYTFAGTDQNELISQVVPGGATFAYTWGRTDRNGLPLLENLTNPNGTTYLWHDDAGSPLAIKTYSGAIAYYALDGLGSPVALINTSGAHIATYSYDPYGQVTIANLTNNTATAISPYRFAGGLDDRTSGWIKYGQRYYDPNIGRFTQQDSLETLADPTRANRYQYAASNPVNFVDLTGRDWSWFGALVGAVSGFAAALVCGGIAGFFATPVAAFYAGLACGTVVSSFVGGAVN